MIALHNQNSYKATTLKYIDFIMDITRFSQNHLAAAVSLALCSSW